MWFNRKIKPQRLQSHSINLNFWYGFFLNFEIILYWYLILKKIMFFQNKTWSFIIVLFYEDKRNLFKKNSFLEVTLWILLWNSLSLFLTWLRCSLFCSPFIKLGDVSNVQRSTDSQACTEPLFISAAYVTTRTS